MSFESSDRKYDFDDQDQDDDFESDEFAENPFKDDAKAELEAEFYSMPNGLRIMIMMNSLIIIILHLLHNILM
jgi:hypothetical protein